MQCHPQVPAQVQAGMGLCVYAFAHCRCWELHATDVCVKIPPVICGTDDAHSGLYGIQPTSSRPVTPQLVRTCRLDWARASFSEHTAAASAVPTAAVHLETPPVVFHRNGMPPLLQTAGSIECGQRRPPGDTVDRMRYGRRAFVAAVRR